MASNQGSGGGGGVTVGLAAAARLGGKATSAVVKQPYPTLDLDPKNMEKVIAFVAEATSEEGNAIAEMLNRAGVLQVTVETDANVLRAKMGEITPDLVIVSASVPGDVFGFVRDIRHSKLGDNPFLMVTTLVDADQAAAVRKAMQAGTDDIIIKPLKEDQLLQRLKRVTVNRQAFVVTSDYLGPDRRAKGRPTSIRRIQVLNTMLEKASGKDIQAEEIKAAVEGSVNDVLHARLDSNSYRLGFVCHIIIDAYKNNNITPDVKDKILVLVDVLRDAAKTAERINEAELGLLCGSLAKQVEEIAERYETPNERDLKTIQKLTRAVMMVVKPHIPAAQMERETKEAAENYLKHQRGEFDKGAEIQRTPDDGPIETVDENVMEIMQVPKGQNIFTQGEVATSAYILASGSVAIYREIEGKRLPVARIRKGEMFGEMAIIDGTARRATAVVLEDSTLSLIAKDMIEKKMAASDPMVQKVMHTLIDSLRSVPENHTPKPRNVQDIANDIKEQAAKAAQLIGESTSRDMKAAAQVPVEKLGHLVQDICGLLDRGAIKDTRAPVKPTTQEIDAAVKSAGG